MVVAPVEPESACVVAKKRKNEAAIIAVSIRSLQPKDMATNLLVERVKTGFRKIAEELPYIIELRERFWAKPRGKANIDGCDTWEQFAERALHRSPRQIRKVIADYTRLLNPEPISKVEPETEIVKVQVSTETLRIKSVAYVSEPEPFHPVAAPIEAEPEIEAEPQEINELQQTFGHACSRLFDVVPVQIKNVIKNELWARCHDKDGKPFVSFAAWVTQPLPRGLESNIDDLLFFCRKKPEIQQLIRSVG